MMKPYVAVIKVRHCLSSIWRPCLPTCWTYLLQGVVRVSAFKELRGNASRHDLQHHIAEVLGSARRATSEVLPTRRRISVHPRRA